MVKKLILLFCFLVLISCSDSSSKKDKEKLYTNNASSLFTKINSHESSINFKNVIREDLEFNFLNYPYLYAGAGISVGDIDNDGLLDIYFTANFGPNKLYKNKGDFVFEDITSTARVEDYKGFTTGTTMLDINNDGWLDIYVCKAGSLDNDEERRNLLFVNQQDGTFKEEAKKWGIDDSGYTTQAYQLDYDKDGDLDLYVLNYRNDFINNTRVSSALQRAIEETTSDQLYRNDGNRFTKVTEETGLQNKAWGLSGAVGDFNNDGWDDIYIANDFLEPDIMYINQQDGTFKDSARKMFNHISFNSMGSDYADLDNDYYPDLVTVDMLAENYARSKENMASMSTDNFMTLVNIGYNYAYMANTLQMNNGNGKFKETGQLSGIVKTDWSWAPLIADYNNDGLKDIFVSNGVYKDYHNQDFRSALKEISAKGESMTLEAVLDMMPAEKLDNYIFKNEGDLNFTKKIKEWGLEDPNFSNGAAYGDFDNDGDLDLIVNNINDEIGFYRNNSNQNYVQVKLKGPVTNSLGIGTSVFIKDNKKTQFQKLYLARGYQSSVSNILNFGLGDVSKIEEVIVQWPDGKVSSVKKPKINQLLTIDYASAIVDEGVMKKYLSKSKNIDPLQLGIKYNHTENNFDDYNLQLLIPQKQSTKGTGIATADINNDGLEDFFVGNALGAPASLYIQETNGTFSSSGRSLWAKESKYEDGNVLFFDADGDGDQDLYVVSSGYELETNSPLLQDRLYINNGKGDFTEARNALPQMISSGKVVTAGDYDADGDLDLFVGGNVQPSKYPLASRSYLLKNEGGKFVDVTSAVESLSNVGMVSDAIFTDYDNDEDLDLLIVGEWMSPTFYTNNEGILSKATTTGLGKTEGWWFSVLAEDFDGDGDEDYVLGNIGKNNKFQPSQEKPLYIYARDFDNNGSFDTALSKLNEGKLVPTRGKECSSEQNPFLLDKIKSYKEFASLDMNAIYGEEELGKALKYTAHIFESVYIENQGGGNFKVVDLPNQSQVGPTLSLINGDFNNDGYKDIMGVGAIYDAEVETIRYDSNYGYVLLGNGKGDFNYSKEYEPFIDRDSKDLCAIKIGGKDYYMVVSNNAPLDIFGFTP